MNEKEFSLPRSTIEVLQSINRLEAVESTGLAGEKTPKAFEQICSTVSSALNAPVAQITLLEEFRQNIKTSLGFDIKEAPSQTAFCAETIASEKDITIIHNTLEDEVFKLSPYVVEPPYIRFYAGCPIVFEGEKVGTLCVYDFKPRTELSEEQVNFIKQLTKDVEAAIYGEKN